MHLQFSIHAVTQIIPVEATAVILEERCGRLTLAGGQVLSKVALLVPSPGGQERDNITKSSWVEMLTEINQQLPSQEKEKTTLEE